jgi:hypothetical protein
MYNPIIYTLSNRECLNYFRRLFKTWNKMYFKLCETVVCLFVFDRKLYLNFF